jgi:hypothetical protein
MAPNGQWMNAFQPSSGVFSPGLPLVPPDPQSTRVFDFAVGSNSNITPRSYETFGFASLRAFSNVELVRLAIETCKDRVERLEWRIKPKNEKKPQHDADVRIRKMERLFRRPDGATDFATWLRMSLEDLLSIDAPAFEKRRSRNGDLIALDVVPGDTIKLLVDETGRRPLPPVAAYQQIIKGRVWNNLTTDDMLYAPRNRRPNHLYGFGPVEQTIVTINTLLRRQTMQLAYFTEGNIPAGLINAPDGWTAQQIKDFQDWMDARLSGNQAERSKLLWGPNGAKYHAFKESPLKDDFDEWLARIVCFAFNIPPTPFIRQMNRGTAADDTQRAMEEGREPHLLWWKRVADGVIQDDCGNDDLEWTWDIPKEVDPVVQAKVHDMYLRNGTLSINRVRDDLGEESIPGGEEPMIYTATGALPISIVLERAAEPQVTPPAPESAGPSGQPQETEK